MQKVIKEKLESLVELMNDPGVVVTEKEAKDKLVKILDLINHPEEITQQQKEVKEKLEKVLLLVSNTMVVPDIDFEYYIPKAETSDHPYILLTYLVNDDKRTRKVSLGTTAQQSTPEDLAKHVVLEIEKFKEDVDDIRMG